MPVTANVEARRMMLKFADRTGLTNKAHSPKRYLWTDAHAVCNFLSLHRYGGTDSDDCLAADLIEQVHSVLGKHRDDDPRSGWISGLDEGEGGEHPTAGGLRIGKKLNERSSQDVYDERLEWDRDGQYFHYLTKWMHALCRASHVLNEPKYCLWALELARSAHAKFIVLDPSGRGRRLHWKMSTDLSRPLVPSSGLHDPLDAYITYKEIEHHAARFPGDVDSSELDAEISETAAMIKSQNWETADPLGIGGLLFDASRVIQLAILNREQSDLATRLLTAARLSLSAYAHTDLRVAAYYRLAFRELGLSIGLHGVKIMNELLEHYSDLFSSQQKLEIDALHKYLPLASTIENFWQEPQNQRAGTWLEHIDINSVMLATSLVPQEFLQVGVTRLIAENASAYTAQTA
jgi:hypothetical protein